MEAQASEALAVLNSVLQAQRIASADPCAPGVRRSDALVLRVGAGAGDAVADGRWTTAVELPPPKPDRSSRQSVLRPQERLAAILGGRDVALACESLALRARADADAARWREAAFELRVALEASLAELVPWSGHGDLDVRLDELRAARPLVAAAANAALEGGLSEPQVADVGRILERLEAALRARTQASLGG